MYFHRRQGRIQRLTLCDVSHAAETLRAQVRLQTNALLNTESIRQAVARTGGGTDASTTTTNITTRHQPTQDPLLSRLDKQLAHNQQCLYRACAAITTFRVRDPDPHAVDHGNILGIRIEVATRAKFLRPYYVLLNRPYTTSKHGQGLLRIHRHTVPPCIPLNGLAARHLPGPSSNSNNAAVDSREASERHVTEPVQNLPRFVRTLRREIVRYHNRVAVVADLRKALGLDGKRIDAENYTDGSAISAISAADAEARQVRIDWKDGRSGRLVVGDDGEVDKLVVFGDKGRERDLTRKLFYRGSRLEEVAKSLASL